VRDFNKLRESYLYAASKVFPRNVGRPLAASDAQRAQVLKLHKAGTSLREIAEETSLGFRTVRTIVDQGNGTDRTARKHRARVYSQPKFEPKRRRKILGKASRASLPKRATAHLEEGRELLKQAKGLKDRG
jgi:transposase